MNAVARTLLLVGAAAFSASCVIVIKPGGGDQPVPVPLSCVTDASVKTAHVFFSTRIDRSTVNLAPAYDNFITQTVLALAGSGVMPTSVALVRADERQVETKMLAGWGCNVASSPSEALRPAPQTVITHYASQPLQSPADGCVSDPLVEMGLDLPNTITNYPVALNGPSGIRMFTNKPDVVLVVHLDALERKNGFDEPACAQAAQLAVTDSDGSLPWLNYAGPNPSAAEVVHWFVATDEGVNDATFYESCRKNEGIDSTYFDALQPSAKLYYTPLMKALSASDQRTATLPICRMLNGQQTDFLVDQALDIAGELGLSPDPDRIKEVMTGGLEALLNQPGLEGSGGLSVPGRRP